MAGLLQKLSGWTSSPAGKLRRAKRLIEAGDRAGAFPLLASAASRGVAEAEFLVARAYMEGGGVPPSGPEAVRWLERAATHGYLEAQSTLAAMYIHGIPGLAAAQAGNNLGARPAAALFSANEPAKPDFERALEWARRAAEGGSADGQALYAYVLTNGPEGTRDFERAEELYRGSAAADCPQGCLGLALALLRNNHDAGQHQQAATLLKRATEAGLPTADYVLGVLYDQGQGGIAQDLELAATYYRQAAQKGVRSAQARYGLALMQGRGAPQDTQEGESWLRRAALQGDPEAAALVGDLYSRGGALPPNHAEAAMWYRRAAEAGHKGS
jgi:TPR repeat protein